MVMNLQKQKELCESIDDKRIKAQMFLFLFPAGEEGGVNQSDDLRNNEDGRDINAQDSRDIGASSNGYGSGSDEEGESIHLKHMFLSGTIKDCTYTLFQTCGQLGFKREP